MGYVLSQNQVDAFSPQTKRTALQVGLASFCDDESIEGDFLSLSVAEQTNIVDQARSSSVDAVPALELHNDVMAGYRYAADAVGQILLLKNHSPQKRHFLAFVEVISGDVSTLSKVVVSLIPAANGTVHLRDVYTTAIERVAHNNLDWEHAFSAQSQDGSVAYRVTKVLDVAYEHIGILSAYL